MIWHAHPVHLREPFIHAQHLAVLVEQRDTDRGGLIEAFELVDSVAERMRAIPQLPARILHGGRYVIHLPHRGHDRLHVLTLRHLRRLARQRLHRGGEAASEQHREQEREAGQERSGYGEDDQGFAQRSGQRSCRHRSPDDQAIEIGPGGGPHHRLSLEILRLPDMTIVDQPEIALGHRLADELIVEPRARHDGLGQVGDHDHPFGR